MSRAAAREQDIAGGSQGAGARVLSVVVQALLWGLTGVVCLLPRAAAYHGLGRLLGLAIYVLTLRREPRLDRKRRGVLRNLRIAFGRDQPPDELRRRARAYARHLAWLVIDVLRLPRLTRQNLQRRVDASALAGLEGLRRGGKGVICASGHMGHWEVLAYAAALAGVPLTALARPIPIPGVQAWLHTLRSGSGQVVLSKFGGLWGLKKGLDRGHHVGLLTDENTRDGVFVPFFGTLAATNPSPAQLQRRTGAAIAVVTCQRLAPERWKVHVWRTIEPDPSLPRDEETRRVLVAVQEALEEAIRAYPEQWLWSLRRWETRPEGEAFDAEGLPPPAPTPLPDGSAPAAG